MTGAVAPAEAVKKEKGRVSHNWRGYLEGLGLVALATLLSELVYRAAAPTTVAMIYLLCVVVTAILGGLGPSIFASVVGTLVFDFFFVPPYRIFDVSHTQYIFTLGALLVVAVLVSYLASRVRRQGEAAIQRERQTAALYALGRTWLSPTTSSLTSMSSSRE